MMRTVRKYLFIALMVSLGARLYVSFFVPGFIITFTAIILGISLYFNEDIHPVILGLIVAVMSPSIRYIFDSMVIEDVSLLLKQIYPDIFFYVTYGIVFYVLSLFAGNHKATKYYIVLFLSDFISNLVELMVRTQVALEWSMIQGIILVAIGRTCLIMLTIFIVVRYTSLLMKQEHEKRYQYLMMLSSRFKSEIYFLHKNMGQIESLVGLSHRLKNQEGIDEATKELTLDLAKGVHEVKKDYLRVVKGLEEIYDGGLNLEVIDLKDLFKIIEVNTRDFLRSKNSEVMCSFKCKTSINIKEHFYLMSIIRNLVNNAIEACGENGKVYVYAQDVNEYIEIYVRDNGTGIKEDERPYIFNTGYSTKFDKETGDIYRGIGLTLVKEMVESIFKGQIHVETAYGEGSSFIVKIKRETLEGSL